MKFQFLAMSHVQHSAIYITHAVGGGAIMSDAVTLVESQPHHTHAVIYNTHMYLATSHTCSSKTRHTCGVGHVTYMQSAMLHTLSRPCLTHGVCHARNTRSLPHMTHRWSQPSSHNAMDHVSHMQLAMSHTCNWLC